MFLKNIFATPLLVGKSNNLDIQEKAISLAYNFKSDATNASLVSDEWNRGHKSSNQKDFDKYGVTSFTSCNLTELSEWKSVCEFILNFAKTMVASVYDNPDNIYLTNMWTTIYPTGAYVPEHTHSNSLLSGVFYVKAPENCGNIVFHDPSFIAKTMMIHKIDQFPTVDTKFIQEVEDGMMILFPSWLPHMTLKNDSKEDRIILSFNIGLIQ
jgi:uncharacterized protein (TIGR02466 family)